MILCFYNKRILLACLFFFFSLNSNDLSKKPVKVRCSLFIKQNLFSMNWVGDPYVFVKTWFKLNKKQILDLLVFALPDTTQQSFFDLLTRTLVSAKLGENIEFIPSDLKLDSKLFAEILNIIKYCLVEYKVLNIKIPVKGFGGGAYGKGKVKQIKKELINPKCFSFTLI